MKDFIILTEFDSELPIILSTDSFYMVDCLMNDDGECIGSLITLKFGKTIRVLEEVFDIKNELGLF